MRTLIDLNKELDEIFHELSPKERMKAMRNTDGVIARKVRKKAVADLTSMSYQLKPRDGKPGKRGTRASSLKDNIIAVPYARAIGFHVTVAARQAKAGGHTKVDHLNRWWQWKPAARWFNTGTEKQEARPFMDGAEHMLDSVEKEMAKVFEEKVIKIAQKHNNG